MPGPLVMPDYKDPCSGLGGGTYVPYLAAILPLPET